MLGRRQSDDGSAERELARERTFGGRGIEIEREIRTIDVSDPTATREEIDGALWVAAVESGFFQIVGHGIPDELTDAAFAMAERFFALPKDVKARWAMPPLTNSGWEYETQKRPSTGTLDQKESFQITISCMEDLDLWPTDDDLAGFRSTMEAFEAANHAVAMRVLSSFARRLGFEDDFFAGRHDRSSPEYQSTLRLLHYFALTSDDLRPDRWRAGAHTDYDCLTLLHQRPGQRGLQVCPGADAPEGSNELAWTSVEPVAGTITCNIGDMLMRWSDDRLPSTLHRVRTPTSDEDLGARFSIAYFAQADRDALIESPTGAFAPIRAHDYLQQRVAANFA